MPENSYFKCSNQLGLFLMKVDIVNFELHVKLQLASFIRFIVTAVGTLESVGLVNFNVTFSLTLVLSSHPPDEPLCVEHFRTLAFFQYPFCQSILEDTN